MNTLVATVHTGIEQQLWIVGFCGWVFWLMRNLTNIIQIAQAPLMCGGFSSEGLTCVHPDWAKPISTPGLMK